ncbi:MAG: SnoaL-like domain-containing protein [Amaricoccus sp.]|uniref:SnoaL-like domain-containing protein n=1 Tax=Amaricoccus sp. TaxID=1872485 RepID=UPI003314D554
MSVDTREPKTEIVKATAEALVGHCRAGTTRQGLKDLYAPDAVSVEAVSMGGESRETRGVKGIEGKHDWWETTMEVHSASADGPYVNGDRFSVIFEFDATDRNSGKRNAMKEVALYTVDHAGKIVREEFFF